MKLLFNSFEHSLKCVADQLVKAITENNGIANKTTYDMNETERREVSSLVADWFSVGFF